MKIADRIERLPRRLIADERGAFIKCLTGHEALLPSYTGEIYICRAAPGQVRGNHYHYKATEWFTVVAGRGELILKDIETDESLVIEVSADQPETIRVPPLLAHVFKNQSGAVPELILVAYTDELYDPADTIPCVIV